MLRMWEWSLLILVATAWTSAAAGAEQAKGKRQLTITDPLEADEDFELQGEYIGAVFSGRCGCTTFGLQVVALGDGRFEAARYQGGLPGAGWNRFSPSRMRGERRGGVLELNDDHYIVIIEQGLASVHDTAGGVLGQLRRVRRSSPTLGARPPANAVILFDGSAPQNLDGARVTGDGLLMVGAATKMPVRDFHMHMEFRTPYSPYARGQKRGNSGVYIQRRYEVQILDSFGLEGAANECGGLYKQRRPDVNMCLPPLSWQTYDIYFSAARWNVCGQKICNARVTVVHNGVTVHCRYALTDKTGAGKPEGPEALPIHFQNHGDPVVFRNVWIVPCDVAAARPWAPRRPLFRRPLFRLFRR